MRRKKLYKRVLTGVLAFLLILSFVFTSLSTAVYANSNSRSQRWIALGAEKSTVSSLGTNEFSYDEMRIIGIFLSNFYVPWSTQISNGNSNDTEANETTKENMVEALTDSLNFNQSIAEGLVSAVFSMSESSAKPLYIDFEDGDDSSDVLCSYANLLTAFFSKKFEQGAEIDIYWKDESGGKHTVFSGKNGTVNPCYYALMTVLSQLNLKSGYGSAFLGTSADFESSGKLSYETVATWQALFANREEMLKACSLGQQMYVDCFGNMICDNGAGRAFVVVPACMNPYTFIKDGSNAGSALPVNNLYYMSLNSKGNLVEASSNKSYDSLKLQPISLRSDVICYRLGRGSGVWDFDTSKMPLNGGNGGSLVKALCDEYTDSPFYMCDTSDHFNSGDVKLYLFGKDHAYNFNNSYSSKVIQDWMLFDSIGGFSSENTDSITANEFGIFGKDWSALSNPVSQQFSTSVDKDNAFNIMVDENSKCYLAGIFTSYVYAYFRSDEIQSESSSSTTDTGIDSEVGKADKNSDSSSDANDSSSESTDKVKYKINLADLPSGGTGNFSVSVSDSKLDNMLKSFMYYILHPSEGVDYIKQWFGKITSSFLLKAHEDIVGNTSTNNTTGGSRYLGFSGYVTVPNLHDLAWTQWLLDNYDTFFVYFVVFMALVLIGYVFLGSLTFQKGIMGLIIFSICAYLPPTLINTTVDLSNKICDSIYGSKFTYWALVQHESYVYEINYAVSQASNSSYNDFLLAQFNAQSDYTSSSSTSVALKWLAPKKDNYLVNFQKEIDEASSGSNLSKVISGLLSERVSGETYLGGNNDMFLYRSYTDISTYSTSSYNWLKRKGTSDIDLASTLNGVKTDSGANLGSKVISSGYLGKRTAEYSLQYATDYGFNYPTQGDSYTSKYCQRVIAPMCSKTVSDAITNALSNVSLSDTKNVGITQDKFQITVSNLNNDDGSVGTTEYGTFTFGEYTESPFYYFSFNLYDQSRYGEAQNLFNNSDGHTYKNLFLQGDGDYFYNNDSSLEGNVGYGELRDYTDMRSLFYCVIPYLKEANDVVKQWDDEYGLWLYDGIDVTYSEGVLESIGESTDSELYYKWWHNVTVCQLFNMYSPWVDKMYDCDYAKSEKITVHGEKFVVNDPLDPYSYYETDNSGNITAGRYMVFSESEMQYYGLTYSDLTQVEKKIINIQKNSYTDLLDLMDYYTFDSEVLNTAAAMIETFNFNKEFSQSSLFGEDFTLYPQSYELKNFTYDAYLRLILVNATGELLQGTDSQGKSVNLYKTILDNTSFITGVLMIGLDVIATYVIPALKLFFLLMVFVLSIFVIIAAILNIQLRIVDVMMNSLVKPLVQFFLVSIGMAFAISLFMSDGNTAVTGRGGFTISLGDPTMTIIAMLGINIAVVVLYWKICKTTFNNCKKYAEAVFTSVAGTATGVLGKITGVTMAGAAVAKALPGNIKNSYNRGLQNKANRTIANGGGTGGSGGSGLTSKGKGVTSSAESAEKGKSTSNKWNEAIKKGRNSQKLSESKQSARKERTEAYEKIAGDKSRSVLTRTKASVLGKASKASEQVHTLGGKVKYNNVTNGIRNNILDKGEKLGNYGARLTNDSKELKSIGKRAKDKMKNSTMNYNTLSSTEKKNIAKQSSGGSKRQSKRYDKRKRKK